MTLGRARATGRSVVGVNLPTFVERGTACRRAWLRRNLSSGLTSRPSLSARTQAAHRRAGSPVVGVNLPTFVERLKARERASRCGPVVGVNLPTFVERANPCGLASTARTLSSGLTSRPSLSVRLASNVGLANGPVVGVNLPTFVERARRRVRPRLGSPVVGVNLPTFVERNAACRVRCAPRRLSSGLTSRPSLSAVWWWHVSIVVGPVVGVNLPTFVERTDPEATAGQGRSVVGVNLPTFVERTSSAAVAASAATCRRG